MKKLGEFYDASGCCGTGTRLRASRRKRCSSTSICAASSRWNRASRRMTQPRRRIAASGTQPCYVSAAIRHGAGAGSKGCCRMSSTDCAPCCAPWRHHRRPALARPRHRRKHRHLQPDGCGDAPLASGKRSRASSCSSARAGRPASPITSATSDSIPIPLSPIAEAESGLLGYRCDLQHGQRCSRLRRRTQMSESRCTSNWSPAPTSKLWACRLSWAAL